jgi:hypothetical protein
LEEWGIGHTATSSTSLPPSFCVPKALRMAGGGARQIGQALCCVRGEWGTPLSSRRRYNNPEQALCCMCGAHGHLQIRALFLLGLIIAAVSSTMLQYQSRSRIVTGYDSKATVKEPTSLGQWQRLADKKLHWSKNCVSVPFRQ